MIVLALPGLAHRLDHGHDDVAAWSSLGGRFEGDRAWVDGGVEEALAWAARRVDGLGVAAAVGPVGPLWQGVPVGALGRRLREAVRYAREGEVFLLPGVEGLPEGVGRFDAPELIVKQLGFPVQVARDYR